MAELISFNDHNLELVYNLSRLGLDMEYIALFFGVTRNQFDAVCEKHPEFLDMRDRGTSLRDKLKSLERNDG